MDTNALLDIHLLDVVVAIAAVSYLWGKAVKPMWQFLRGMSHQQDRQSRLNKFADHWHNDEEVEQDAARWKVLQEIADQFKPNDGTTLWDQVQQQNVAIAANADAIAEIGNKIDTFILERQNGGRRKYDPHEESD